METTTELTKTGTFKSYWVSETGFQFGQLTNGKETIYATLSSTMDINGFPVTGVGMWKINKKGQRVFHFRNFSLQASGTPNYVLKAVLSSSLLPGIGEVKATAMIMKWGDNVFEHLGSRTDLLSIPGIGAKRAGDILIAWAMNRKRILQTLVCLKFGLTLPQAQRAYNKFGDELNDVFEKNPYALIAVGGITFRDIDGAIRQRLGDKFDPNNKDRWVAALLDTFTNLESLTGSTRFSMAEISKELSKRIKVDKNQLEKTINESDFKKIGENWSLSETYYEEKSLAEYLKDHIGVENPELFEWDNKLDEEQRIAAQTLISYKTSILTGPPGTGKTTVTKELARYYKYMDYSVLWLSPTAKAARHLHNVAGVDAHTIHSVALSNEEIIADVIIFDESSMIEQNIFTKLLSKCTGNEILHFIGDAFQLPPVGRGQVFRDMILAGIPTAKLTKIYRQNGHSGIAKLAHAIKSGKFAPIHQFGPDVEWYDLKNNDILQTTLRLFEEWDRPPIIAAYRREVSVLNTTIQKLVADLDEQQIMKVGRYNFAIGDRVRQTKNDYKRGVVNGMIGTVTWLNPLEFTDELEDIDLVQVDFGNNKVVGYKRDDLLHLKLGWAITIHASQGSEWERVVVILPWSNSSWLREFWLTRELPYTAISRAKKQCAIIGIEEAYRHYFKAKAVVNRKTNLETLLKDG